MSDSFNIRYNFIRKRALDQIQSSQIEDKLLFRYYNQNTFKGLLVFAMKQYPDEYWMAKNRILDYLNVPSTGLNLKQRLCLLELSV